MDPVTVVVIGGLATINLAMLAAIWWLQRKIADRDGDVNATQRDLDRLKGEANNVAFAKILLRTEHAVGADLQESIRELTDGFTQQLNGPLLRMATQMERGVGKVLEQHMETKPRKLRRDSSKPLRLRNRQLCPRTCRRK